MESACRTICISSNASATWCSLSAAIFAGTLRKNATQMPAMTVAAYGPQACSWKSPDCDGGDLSRPNSVERKSIPARKAARHHEKNATQIW